MPGAFQFPRAVLLQLHKLRQHGAVRGRVCDQLHGGVDAASARVQLRGLRELVSVRQCPGAEQLRGHDVPERHRGAGREQQLFQVQHVGVRE